MQYFTIKYLTKVSILVLLCLIFFAYGGLVARFKIFPYEIGRSVWAFFVEYPLDAAPPPLQRVMPQTEAMPDLSFIDQKGISDLINIRNAKDVAVLRGEMIKAVWGVEGLPFEAQPTRYEKNIRDPLFPTDNVKNNLSDQDVIKNLKQIDKLLVIMEHGFPSVIYHFVPIEANGEAVIYHQGHDGHFSKGKTVIRRLLSEGYAVTALAMPKKGLNIYAPDKENSLFEPTINIKGLGPVTFGHEGSKHNNFTLLERDDFTPLKLFIHPVLVAVNYLEQKLGYRNISMLGISGGGWTTTFYAALDPRVQKSYPVAGTLPFYLKAFVEGAWGDYEQQMVPIYRRVNYLEMYVLGSIGDGRRQVQIFNLHDPAHFSGEVPKHYADVVTEIVKNLELGGSYQMFFDRTNRNHTIGDQGIQAILADLAKKN